MVKELDNFRQKYPQYNDVDDAKLANMLASKYPDAYGDLPSKLIPKQDQIVSPGLQAIGETALMMGTGAIAEPIAGIAGLAKTITSGVDAGAETIKDIQGALTYQPRGDFTKEALGKVGEFVEPITTAYKENIADPAADKFGPAAGAAVMSLPTAIMELVGLKVGRSLSKANAEKILKRTDISQAYDATGKIIPEVKDKLISSGISQAELQEILPDIMPRWMIDEQGKRLGDLGVTGSKEQVLGLKSQYPKINVSQEAVEAAKEFGLDGDIPAHQLLDDPRVLPLVKTLKSKGSSELANQDAKYVQALNQKYKELINEFGGTEDKGALSSDFEARSNSVIEAIKKTESGLYDEAKSAIGEGSPIEASATMQMLGERIKKLGSKKDLDTREKRLLERLKEENILQETGVSIPGLPPLMKSVPVPPTYSRLDQYRKWIGEALGKKTGPFSDMAEGELKQLYKSLAEDQAAAAEKYGAGDLYKAANALTVERKGVEGQLKAVLGNRLQNQVTTKAVPAIKGLGTGDVKKFREFMKNVPEQLGEDTRRAIIATSIGDLASKNGKLDIRQFNNFWNGVNSKISSRRALAKELGEDNYNRLNSFHALTKRISREKEITDVDLDTIENITGKLYEAGGRIAVYQAVGNLAKRAPTAVSGVINSLIFQNVRSVRSRAADQMLASNAFKKMVIDSRSGRLSNTQKINSAVARVEKLAAYKKWKNSLNSEDAAELAKVGLIGYLTGEQTRDE